MGIEEINNLIEQYQADVKEAESVVLKNYYAFKFKSKESEERIKEFTEFAENFGGKLILKNVFSSTHFMYFYMKKNVIAILRNTSFCYTITEVRGQFTGEFARSGDFVSPIIEYKNKRYVCSVDEVHIEPLTAHNSKDVEILKDIDIPFVCMI